MANGDAAVAAGMDVVSGTADRRLGYDEINKTRDYIAQRTSAVTPVARGGTGADTAAGARANLGVGTAGTRADGYFARALTNLVGLRWTGSRLKIIIDNIADAGDIATTGDIDTLAGNIASLTVNKRDIGDGAFPAATPVLVPHAYNNPVTAGTYYALYVQPDGRLGRTPSAAKYKHDIEDYDGSVLGIRPVLYVLNDDPYQTVRLGVIADDADDIEPLLVQRNDGEIEGFSYELLAVALLRDVQRLEARVRALEDR